MGARIAVNFQRILGQGPLEKADAPLPLSLPLHVGCAGISGHGASLLSLNPLYDTDRLHGRLEQRSRSFQGICAFEAEKVQMAGPVSCHELARVAEGGERRRGRVQSKARHGPAGRDVPDP